MLKPAPLLQSSSQEVGRAGPEGALVEFTLENPRTGFSLSFLNLGGALTRVLTPDKDGCARDVVLGYRDPAHFLDNPMFLNAVVGRVCGRIAGARFSLDGKNYALFANDGKNHLHGGRRGFSHRLWDVELTPEGARLSYSSGHLEEGYPGKLDVQVEYSLLRDVPGYQTRLTATTDRPTVVNLNTHEYFDLSGGQARNVLQSHRLRLPSTRFLEMTKGLVPSGRVCAVQDHPAFDFTSAASLALNRSKPDAHWAFMQGFDHSFLVEGAPGPGLHLAAELSCAASGIALRVRTNQSVVHFYGGDFLDPALGGVRLEGKRGEVYGRNAGICFECQAFPDAVHQKAFPSIELRPGEVYSNVTERVFGVLDSTN